MSDREDEIRQARQEYERAMAEIKKATPGKPGLGNEARLGQAYARLVRLGVKPPLRGKYKTK